MINDACAVPVTSERVVYSVKDKISVLQMCTDCFFFANFQVQKCTCLGNLVAQTIDIVISQRNYDSVLSLSTTLQRGDRTQAKYTGNVETRNSSAIRQYWRNAN